MTSRRDFLKYSLGAAAILAAPAVFAKTAVSGERALRFHNIHTGENIKATYWADGEYVKDELVAMDRVLRDFRSNEIAPIDKDLYDLVYALQQQADTSKAFHVISGYRSARTNAKLRKSGGGVAKRSLHMQGRAIDIRLPGTDLKHLRKMALNMSAGGVGYYPKSNFIHVDTGRPRFW